MKEKTIEFAGGGVLKLDKSENGIGLSFQAPHLGEQFRIVSMNVVLTLDEAKDILTWLTKVFQEE